MLEIRDLRKTYPGGVGALKGVSLAAAPARARLHLSADARAVLLAAVSAFAAVAAGLAVN